MKSPCHLGILLVFAGRRMRVEFFDNDSGPVWRGRSKTRVVRAGTTALKSLGQQGGGDTEDRQNGHTNSGFAVMQTRFWTVAPCHSGFKLNYESGASPMTALQIRLAWLEAITGRVRQITERGDGIDSEFAPLLAMLRYAVANLAVTPSANGSRSQRAGPGLRSPSNGL